MRVSVFRKNFLIKYSMYRVENNISLFMIYKVISIILIYSEYYQFRIWHKFFGTNFTRKEHIGSTAKDTEVWLFKYDCLSLLPKKIS